MGGCAVRECGPGDEAGARALIESYRYNDLRRYRLFSRERQAAYLLHKLAACRADGKVLVAERDGAVRALAAARPLSWDSSIFGVRMGHVPLFVHGEGASREDLAALRDALLDRCRADGYAHLNVRADADDFPLIHCLEAAGFFLTDTIVTYIFIPRRQELGHGKYLFKTRLYRPEDHDGVLRVAEEAYRGFIGRYHADPRLPRERCDRLYRLWAERILDAGIAERIIVAERKGKVVGFLGYRLKRDILDATGVKVVGGGLGGCLPEGFGAYVAILEEAMREGMRRYDMQDFETQLGNVNIVRVYQKLNFEYARARHTFHAWLD
ncbi:MAG: hypothetical protein PHN82_07180 [bacterium]|nr:hypothetical protein [bacterium]